jgi:hypothetical protein
MWAMLDYDNKTVKGVIHPNAPLEEMSEFIDGRTLILMTLENSPAWVSGTYEDGKFYSPKELTNG